MSGGSMMVMFESARSTSLEAAAEKLATFGLDILGAELAQDRVGLLGDAAKLVVGVAPSVWRTGEIRA